MNELFPMQVLAFKELPRVVEWENNTAPLCPFEVDEENSIDESGGHTLQVCFSSNCLGGGVFGGGCSEEEFRFCACPELLVTRLIMEPMDENEAVIITVSGRGGDGKGTCLFVFTSLFYQPICLPASNEILCCFCCSGCVLVCTFFSLSTFFSRLALCIVIFIRVWRGLPRLLAPSLLEATVTNLR